MSADKAAALRHFKKVAAAGIGRVCSYSGRGMFGRYCIGVSMDRGDEHDSLFKGARFDSMGLGIIAYWPQFEWDDATMTEGDR